MISVLEDVEWIDDGQDDFSRLGEAVLQHILRGPVHELPYIDPTTGVTIKSVMLGCSPQLSIKYSEQENGDILNFPARGGPGNRRVVRLD